MFAARHACIRRRLFGRHHHPLGARGHHQVVCRDGVLVSTSMGAKEMMAEGGGRGSGRGAYTTARTVAGGTRVVAFDFQCRG